MTSSNHNNPFQRGACLPWLNTNGQSEHFATAGANTNTDGICNLLEPEMKQTELLLASEMNKLSAAERAIAFDDLHCVGEDLAETPEIVQNSLADFELAVHKEQHQIYELAATQDRSFVENPTFRLKFLRANSHNVEKAVRQMMDFLENKARYFGEDKIAREITLSDMNEDEISLMLSGHLYIQEGRDRRGRQIFHLFQAKRNGYSTDTVLRAAYYTLWNMLGNLNDDAQMKGVIVIWHVPLFMVPNFAHLMHAVPFFNSLPLRASATHICHEVTSNFLQDQVICHILKNVSQQVRVRCRLHGGSSMEIRYQLQTYGIPLDTFPLDEDGNLREDIMGWWLLRDLQESNYPVPFRAPADVARSGAAQEELDMMNLNVEFDDQLLALVMQQDEGANENLSGSQAEARIIPTNTDVLFGKGYRVQSHPGNVRFRSLVVQHRLAYDDCPRGMRMEVALRVARSLRADGIRFLQKNESGEWVESDIGEASKRVGQIFRELRKKPQREGQS